MARIPPTSPVFCTKDQIAKDVAFVLTSPLSYGTKHGVLKRITWVWTEFDGKYKGCRRWTKAALLQHQRTRTNRGLRHEHAVPKRVIIDMLFALSDPTQKSVRDICERFLIGVVVTHEEDAVLSTDFRQSMPVEFFDATSADYHDPILRYRRCEIEVVVVS